MGGVDTGDTKCGFDSTVGGEKAEESGARILSPSRTAGEVAGGRTIGRSAETCGSAAFGGGLRSALRRRSGGIGAPCGGGIGTSKGESQDESATSATSESRSTA